MFTFRPAYLEAQLRVEPTSRTVRVGLPASVPVPHDRPTLSLPIQGIGGLLGEIALWIKDDKQAAPPERLLIAMAAQVALALERARLAEAANRAKVLEQSDALKSALLSSVSHELRSPLATIKASASSLHTEAVAWDSEARMDLLAAIEEEADHLNQLVGNLLDMSRIEAGSLTPQSDWNVLAEIIRSVLSRMRKAAATHQVSVEVSEDLPLVAVDFVMIEQVFANLLSNSIKYSPLGTTIAISAHPRDAEWMAVEVRNQGPPLAQEDLLQVFEPFHRVTAAERVTGTGLGLSICKGLVEAHGGRIWAENVPGGLAFKFTLPLTWGGRGPLATEEA
jgi:two-component system sensor histidine kinase KdpD